MRLSAIQTAFNAELTALGADLTLPIAVEAMDFTPPTSGAYLQSRLLPTDIRAAAQGDDAPNVETGVFQTDVVCLAGAGWSDAASHADAVAVRFARGKRINAANGEFEIVIEKTWAGPGVIQDGRYRIPVSAAYRAYTPA